MNEEYTTPEKILESASVPAKPSLLRKDIFYDWHENEQEYSVEFMLSSDFIEFNSHAEPAMCHQYEPFSDEDFTGYDTHLPYLMLAPEEDCIFEIPEEDRIPVHIGKAVYKAKIPYYQQIMTFYGFEENTIISQTGLVGMGMVYNKDTENTPLETKLLSALEEAVRTYKEIKIK